MTLRIAFAGAAALVLAASSSAAAPRPARPSAIPPAPLSSLHGRIVYSIRDGDIWVVNADGSKRRRITRSGRGNDFDPDFSPDGPRIGVRASWSPESRRIAWGNGAAVWVMNADGTHTQLVSRAGGVPGAWAP